MIQLLKYLNISIDICSISTAKIPEERAQYALQSDIYMISILFESINKSCNILSVKSQ